MKPHPPPWFSAACAAAIVHRDYFFRLYQQNKSSESRVKFRQASNHCKRVLEAAKLAYATKTKESITFQKLGSQEFWRITNGELLASVSDKAKFFTKNFSNNSNFGDLGISLPVFPSRTNLKLHNISITPKESCCPDCWKVSSVVPAFKNAGGRFAAKSYCSVSLLSVVSKVFEKLVSNRIVYHLEKYGLFLFPVWF